MRDLFKNNFRFRLSAILVLGQALALLVISYFHIGGDDFIAFLFAAIAPVYALIAAVTVYVGWHSSNPGEVSRQIWGWLFLGLAMWAIAEVLWLYFTIAYQQETPFPSPADLFWVVGTFPLFMAFILRFRSFKIDLNQQQMFTLTIANVVFLIFIATFILPQIFVNADPARWLETVINLFYAITDLFMFGLSLGIMMNLQRGRLSTVWGLILWSNIIRSIADTFFAYVSWNQATLPQNVYNTLNYLYNIPYLSSYLLIALGMLVYRLLIKEGLEEESSLKIRNETVFSLALIFTNSQNNIITTSNNISTSTFTETPKKLAGQALHTLLGTDAQTIDKMVAECRQKGYINNYAIEIHAAKLGHFQAWMTATRDGNSANLFTGLNILLRVKAADLYLADLNAEFKPIAQRILTDTGQAGRENIALLKEYFVAEVFGLYKLIDSFAGGPAAEYLLNNINQTSAYNQWNIEITPAGITLPENFDEKELGRAFIQLLKIVTGYAVDMTSAQAVADEIKKSERGLDAKIIHMADDFGLRGSKLSYKFIELDYKSR